MIGFYGKQILKMFAQHVLFPICYAVGRRKKVVLHSVVFADAHKEQCPEQMQRLVQVLKEKDYQVTEYFFDLGKLGTIRGIGKMLSFMKVYATTQFVILQDNFLPVASCKKRKETTVIQLWHGCGAFKKFGYDAEDDIPVYYKGNVYKNYDLVTVSSPYCRQFFQSAMRIRQDDVVQAMGSSYTDRYYDAEYKSSVKKKLECHYGSFDNKYVIVWAPTFRGNAGCQEDGENRLVLGENFIDELGRNPNYLVIKSLHPHMLHGEKQPFHTSELLIAADLLITDYSSVFFEYLLLDKPIIFFAPDYEQYEKRGWYLEYESLPGCIVTDATKLSQVVETVFTNQETNQETIQKRREFRTRYMECCDGNATDRIVQYMIDKEKETRC